MCLQAPRSKTSPPKKVSKCSKPGQPVPIHFCIPIFPPPPFCRDICGHQWHRRWERRRRKTSRGCRFSCLLPSTGRRRARRRRWKVGDTFGSEIYGTGKDSHFVRPWARTGQEKRNQTVSPMEALMGTRMVFFLRKCHAKGGEEKEKCIARWRITFHVKGNHKNIVKWNVVCKLYLLSSWCCLLPWPWDFFWLLHLANCTYYYVHELFGVKIK